MLLNVLIDPINCVEIFNQLKSVADFDNHLCLFTNILELVALEFLVYINANKYVFVKNNISLTLFNFNFCPYNTCCLCVYLFLIHGFTLKLQLKAAILGLTYKVIYNKKLFARTNFFMASPLFTLWTNEFFYLYSFAFVLWPITVIFFYKKLKICKRLVSDLLLAV